MATLRGFLFVALVFSSWSGTLLSMTIKSYGH